MGELESCLGSEAMSGKKNTTPINALLHSMCWTLSTTIPAVRHSGAPLRLTQEDSAHLDSPVLTDSRADSTVPPGMAAGGTQDQPDAMPHAWHSDLLVLWLKVQRPEKTGQEALPPATCTPPRQLHPRVWWMDDPSLPSIGHLCVGHPRSQAGFPQEQSLRQRFKETIQVDEWETKTEMERSQYGCIEEQVTAKGNWGPV